MLRFRFLFLTFIIEILLIVSIGIATLFNGTLFYVFYNGMYGLVLSFILPLILTCKAGGDFSTLGIKKCGIKQLVVISVFIFFSIGGQIIPKIIAKSPINYNLLPICLMPLIMTTFFEEFLFRGYMQTRFDMYFGSIPSIFLSGALFSLYHLGYPGFRTIQDIVLLFMVGCGFALAFTLSGNNLIVSYVINLPNALLTYFLKSEQFPRFTAKSSIYAGITIGILCMILLKVHSVLNAAHKKVHHIDVKNK